MSSKQHVYLICNAAANQYKIGVTKNDVEKRVKQLQTGNGDELHLVAQYETEFPYYIEKMLHLAFHNYRSKGEWFSIDDTDVIGSFKDLCEKYNATVSTMRNNPFFKKMANID